MLFNVLFDPWLWVLITIAMSGVMWDAPGRGYGYLHAPGRVRQHLGYCGECHGVLHVHPLGCGDHIRPRAFCVAGSGQCFPALQPPSKPGAAGTAQPGSGYLRGGGPFASSHAVTVAWVRGQCPPKLHSPPQSTCVGRSPPWARAPILCPAIQAQSACRASVMGHAHISTLVPTSWRHVWTFSVSVYHTYAIQYAV